MILITRRHWVQGGRWLVMASHYAIRVVALLAITFGVNAVIDQFDVRIDGTAERLSSLSPDTIALLNQLKASDGQPIKIEAFISPDVPENYVQTRLNLINTLREIENRGGKNKILVRINSTERFSAEESRALKKYGITPRQLFVKRRGNMTQEEVFMTIAVSSGARRVAPTFIDRGIPVEYEVVRSLMTVTQQKRKRVGVLQTDAALLGQMNFMMPTAPKRWPIVDELEKAYDIVRVDPAAPITEKFDVLLAVQPSSLGPEPMKNFIAAVKAGQPTAIFEDPFPYFQQNMPGTADPKRPPQQMPFMMNQGATPKGRIQELWDLLGVDFSATQVVYQKYNPYPKLQELYAEFVFVDRNCGASQPFNDDNVISSKLQHVLLPFTGFISPMRSPSLKFTPLVRTGEKTGTLLLEDMKSSLPAYERQRVPTQVSYVLAAQIAGVLPADAPAADAKTKDGKPAPKPAPTNVNVVLVADSDLIAEPFFRIRSQGDTQGEEGFLDFDNVTFALNIIDSLANDDQLVEIRKRRPEHRTLTQIDKATEESRKASDKALAAITKRLKQADEEEEKKIKESIADLQKGFEKDQMTTQDVAQRLDMALKQANQRKQADLENLERDLQKERKKISMDLDQKVRDVQTGYKMFAVLLPPIPPLLVALVFVIIRRAREREGVSRARLRS
jgi:ABC-2 type transport system permease protein